MDKPANDNALGLFFIIMGAAAVVWIGTWFFGRLSDKRKYRQDLIDAHITRAKIIAVNGIEKTVTKGAISRAIVGGMLAGEEGALLGALTAKTKTTVQNEYTFLVYYDNKFNPETEKVKESSPRFRTLVNKLAD